MLLLRCGIAALLLFSPQQRDTTPRRPKVASTSRPSQPVYVQIPPKNHGHSSDNRSGTQPCATVAYCPPAATPRQTSASNDPRTSGDSRTGGDRRTGDDHHSDKALAIGLGTGIFAGALIAGLAHGSEPINKLSDKGPQFPQTLHMSRFKVTGFVKGGWPLVLDYEAAPSTYAVLTIVAARAEPYSVLIPTENAGRRYIVLRIPETLGDALLVGDFTIVASASASDSSPRYFRVYGFGCGRKAVGSIAIDQLTFNPQTITAAHSDTQFGFHTHENFDRLKAEFMQVALVDHCLEGSIFDDKKIDKRLTENQYWSDQWNAKKAHPGQIQFRVRGWMTAAGGGDWVSAYSPDLVLKQ